MAGARAGRRRRAALRAARGGAARMGGARTSWTSGPGWRCGSASCPRSRRSPPSSPRRRCARRRPRCWAGPCTPRDARPTRSPRWTARSRSWPTSWASIPAPSSPRRGCRCCGPRSRRRARPGCPASSGARPTSTASAPSCAPRASSRSPGRAGRARPGWPGRPPSSRTPDPPAPPHCPVPPPPRRPPDRPGRQPRLRPHSRPTPAAPPTALAAPHDARRGVAKRRTRRVETPDSP